MKRLRAASLLGTVALAALAPATAAAEGLALGVKASTLGYGVDLTKSLAHSLNFRGGINNYTYDFNETDGGIDYRYELDLRSANLVFDWHPFNGVFRVTAGALYNKNEVDGNASGSVTVGSTTANASVNAKVTFKKSAPYLGIGWGNAVAARKGFGFAFDLGVVFQGSPDVKLTVNDPTGTITAADIAQEEAELKEDVKDFDRYPLIGFAVTYQF